MMMVVKIIFNIASVVVNKLVVHFTEILDFVVFNVTMATTTAMIMDVAIVIAAVDMNPITSASKDPTPTIATIGTIFCVGEFFWTPISTLWRSADLEKPILIQVSK